MQALVLTVNYYMNEKSGRIRLLSVVDVSKTHDLFNRLDSLAIEALVPA